MENKKRSREQSVILNKTFNLWVRSKAIKVGIIATILGSFSLLYLSKEYGEHSIFLGFIGELGAVFIGLIFGFYWDWAHKKRLSDEGLERIYIELLKELDVNKNYLLEFSKRLPGYNGDLLLKITSWDIYNETIGKHTGPPIDFLTEIYHPIISINENIKSTPDSRKIPNLALFNLKKMAETSIKKIEDWETKMKDWYPELVEQAIITK